jgi:hypothetical protein
MMKEELNLDCKRVCDISADLKTIVIRKKDCMTIITANPDGTLNITHQRVQAIE